MGPRRLWAQTLPRPGRLVMHPPPLGQPPLPGPAFLEYSQATSSHTMPPLLPTSNASPQGVPFTLPSLHWFSNLDHLVPPHLLLLLLFLLLLIIFWGGRKLLCSNYSLWVPTAGSSCSGVAGPGFRRRRRRWRRARGPRERRGRGPLLGDGLGQGQLGGPALTPLAA